MNFVYELTRQYWAKWSVYVDLRMKPKKRETPSKKKEREEEKNIRNKKKIGNKNDNGAIVKALYRALWMQIVLCWAMSIWYFFFYFFKFVSKR